MTINTASAVACVATLALGVGTQLGIDGSTARVGLVAAVAAAAAQRPEKSGEFATFTTLPSLPRGGPSEALAVNSAGTVVVGYSWGSDDLLYGVKWTLQNGSWVITPWPWPDGASSTKATSVSDPGDAAGDGYPGRRSNALRWPSSGGVTVLGCNDNVGRAAAYGISGDGQLVTGSQAVIQVVDGEDHLVETFPSVWRPGTCRVDLPRLSDAKSGAAYAANGDGTVVGGSSAQGRLVPTYVPVRWTVSSGLWQIEQLDTRPGSARAGNTRGDMAGYVAVPSGASGCVLADGCRRAMIWYVQGDARELGTLGGAHSVAFDINASGEVVGLSTDSQVGETAFFWSPSMGMVKLPFKGQAPAARGISDVRADGTRLVVGIGGQGRAMVWTLRP